MTQGLSRYPWGSGGPQGAVSPTTGGLSGSQDLGRPRWVNNRQIHHTEKEKGRRGKKRQTDSESERERETHTEKERGGSHFFRRVSVGPVLRSEGKSSG